MANKTHDLLDLFDQQKEVSYCFLLCFLVVSKFFSVNRYCHAPMKNGGASINLPPHFESIYINFELTI